MPAAHCWCGFTEAPDETITDHLLAAFTPDDSRGPDGQVHDEGQPGHCLCGLALATSAGLDEHFLAVFTPGDRVGNDGGTHKPQP